MENEEKLFVLCQQDHLLQHNLQFFQKYFEAPLFTNLAKRVPERLIIPRW